MTDVVRQEIRVVYVQLVGEGTEVYRPAKGIAVGEGVVKLLRPDGYNPDDEDWEFKPGTEVRVEPRRLADGVVMAAVARAM